MNSKKVSNLIKSRQSFYIAQMEKGAKIPDKDIWKLLENANYAPSHKRTEPWRYFVYQEESLKAFFQKMGEIYTAITPKEAFKADKIAKYQKRGETLSHLLVVWMKRDEQERLPKQEEEYAVACSVQNILLSMKSLNIIGYWSTGNIAFSQELHDYLGLGEMDVCMGFIQLGVPKAGLPQIKKKQISGIETKVEWK